MPDILVEFERTASWSEGVLKTRGMVATKPAVMLGGLVAEAEAFSVSLGILPQGQLWSQSKLSSSRPHELGLKPYIGRNCSQRVVTQGSHGKVLRRCRRILGVRSDSVVFWFLSALSF